MKLITTKIDGNILLIGLNRPKKLNAFNVQMLDELSDAFTKLENIKKIRCGLLYSTSENFTSGLDLLDVTPHIKKGKAFFKSEKIDPLQLTGIAKTKPVVVAVQGYCYTLGIELILANDICVASTNTIFAQIEVSRGLYPFAGATIRFTKNCGKGNAMRYLLTGDEFKAEEAFRIGLIQGLIEGSPFDEALKIARRISAQSPIGIQYTLKSFKAANDFGELEEGKNLFPRAKKIMQTKDAQEGLNSFLERRAPQFSGK